MGRKDNLTINQIGYSTLLHTLIPNKMNEVATKSLRSIQHGLSTSPIQVSSPFSSIP